MKEKRWNGTDSEKTDLICKLTVDNILFLSEKRLPNVSNKKNAKYEEFIDLLSYGMLLLTLQRYEMFSKICSKT